MLYWQKDIDTDMIIMSNNAGFVEEKLWNCISYNDDENVILLCIMLPKWLNMLKSLMKQNTWLFLTKDDQLLTKL